MEKTMTDPFTCGTVRIILGGLFVIFLVHQDAALPCGRRLMGSLLMRSIRNGLRRSSAENRYLNHGLLAGRTVFGTFE